MKPKPQSLPRSGAAGLLLASLALALPGPLLADSARAAAEPATVLDPVFVEASTGNPWQLITTPGFEILSRCPDAFNERYVRALQKAEAARLAFLPASFWGDLPTPIDVILYNREPEHAGGIIPDKPIDLTWGGEDGAIIGSESIQQTHPVMAGDGDTFIDCGNYWDVQEGGDSFSVDVDSPVRLSNRLPGLPSWFLAGIEGPSGLYANRVIRAGMGGDTMILPNLLWVSSRETLAIQDEVRKLKRDGGAAPARPILPLGLVFAGAAPPHEGALLASETALLVRWGLYRCADRKAFLNFVDQASRQPVTEELFRQCLGMGFDEAQAQMSAYLPEAASQAISIPLPSPTAEPLHVHGASQSEVARIIGSWGRLEGRATGPEVSEYQDECLRQADRLFGRALLSRVADPAFLAAVGLYELQSGDSGRGRKALEEATSQGVVRPMAYVELARTRLEDALPTIPGGLGDLNEAQFAEIQGLLRTARVQMPSLASTYYLLARVLQHAPQAPSDENLYVLNHALELFPRNATLAYSVATLYRRLGLAGKAEAIIARSTSFAESEHDRALLASFPIQGTVQR